MNTAKLYLWATIKSWLFALLWFVRGVSALDSTNFLIEEKNYSLDIKGVYSP